MSRSPDHQSEDNAPRKKPSILQRVLRHIGIYMGDTRHVIHKVMQPLTNFADRQELPASLRGIITPALADAIIDQAKAALDRRKDFHDADTAGKELQRMLPKQYPQLDALPEEEYWKLMRYLLDRWGVVPRA